MLPMQFTVRSPGLGVELALAILPFVARDLPLTSKSLLVLGGLGVFQIGLAYAFFVRGLRSVTATQASLTGMLFGESHGCSSNNTLLIGGLGLAALLLLGGRLGTTTTST